MKTTVLNSEQIKRIIQRIAYQTIETNGNEGELLIVGIEPRGSWVAQSILQNLNALSDIKSTLKAVDPNNLNGLDVNGKTVLVVDDIVNSGVTMMKVAGHVTQNGASRVMTACLVDRLHRKFPIQSEFTGLSLATTLQEHLSLKTGELPEITLE